MFNILLLVMSIFSQFDGTIIKNNKVIDLGEHETGETIVHNEYILNETDFLPPYQVRAKSCKCIDTILITDPNGTTYLAIKIQVKEAGLQSSVLLLESKTSNTIKHYEFLVHGKDSFTISPSKGYFQVKSNLDKYIVTLRYFTIDKNSSAIFDKMETRIPELLCGQVKTMQKYEKSNKLNIFTFEIPLSYQTTDKQNDKTISEEVKFYIKTSNGGRIVSFPLIIITGQSEYLLNPEKIFFLYSKTSSKVLNKIVKIKFKDGVVVKSLSIKQNGQLPLKIVTHQNSELEYLLNISIETEGLNNLPFGTMKGGITVKFEGTQNDEQALIPVTLVISK